MDSLPKKTLVKRFILVRESQMKNLSDPHLMNQNAFSLKCIPLAPWSNHSGQGDSRTWMVWVYCEPESERKMIAALDSIGLDIGGKEREAVDPDTTDEQEQIMLTKKEQSQHICLWEHQVLMEGEQVT